MNKYIMVHHKHESPMIGGRRSNNPSSIPLNNRSTFRLHRALISRHHIPHKSSPYVGWFRHAPDISSCQIRRCRILDVRPWNSNSTSFPTFRQEKSSPYVGWFRHSPPSNLYEKKKGRINTILGLNVTEAGNKKGCFNIHSYDHDNIPKKKSRRSPISGRLPGGGPVHHNDDIGNPESATISTKILDSFACPDIPSVVLTKVTNWFLFPMVNDDIITSLAKDNNREVTLVKGMTNILLPYLCSAFKRLFFLEGGTSAFKMIGDLSTAIPSHRDDLSETDLSEYSHSSAADRDESLRDLGSLIKDAIDSPSPIEFEDHHISVSSLAEAYYVEQARQEILDQYPHSSFNPLTSLDIEDNQSQDPDYSISQIDITRMARNASRHLDVESILKLPSITYKKNERVGDGAVASSSIDASNEGAIKSNMNEKVMEKEEEELGWSWILTPEVTEEFQTPMDKTSDTKVDNVEDLTEGNNALEEKCVICLEQFMDGDRIRVLPCGHLFHMGCIDKWLSGTFSHHECFTSGCPTCKKPPNVIDHEELDENESNLEASSDDSVPSWAFANLGGSLAMEA